MAQVITPERRLLHLNFISQTDIRRRRGAVPNGRSVITDEAIRAVPYLCVCNIARVDFWRIFGGKPQMNVLGTVQFRGRLTCRNARERIHTLSPVYLPLTKI
jgi:hypothetical protein